MEIYLHNEDLKEKERKNIEQQAEKKVERTRSCDFIVIDGKLLRKEKKKVVVEVQERASELKAICLEMELCN